MLVPASAPSRDSSPAPALSMTVHTRTRTRIRIRTGAVALIALSQAVAFGCGGQPSSGDASMAPAPSTSVEAPAVDELASESAKDALYAILDASWERSMRRYPGWATYEGDRRYDDQVYDPSEPAREAYIVEGADLVEQMRAIASTSLEPVDQDTQRMYIASWERRRARDVCRSHEWSVDGLGGPQVDWPMMPVFHTIRTQDDVANLARRYEQLGGVMDETIANLERGLASGLAATEENVRRALGQTDALLATPIDDDPMLTLKPEEEGDAFDTAPLRAALERHVRPALERYRDFLRDHVTPAARTEVGVSALPIGAQCYEAQMAGHIGPGFNATDVHQLGIEQLEWAHNGMMQVAEELGLEMADAQEMIDWMRDNPGSYTDDEDELLALNAVAVEHATGLMHEAFGRLPQADVIVEPIEEYRAADAPAAYYNSPPEDGSRPGIYYVNLHQPQTRPLYNLEALAYHEAIPGHHLQLAIAGELPNTHSWRRSAGQTAFVEGWALYAEVLADELGWYTSPEARFGMYNYQAWRASRLVVDTGMHALGWTRAEAL
ncbi:MAG: hypothetical protein ACI82G_002954, partial [Bradymonadia bacterium]